MLLCLGPLGIRGLSSQSPVDLVMTKGPTKRKPLIEVERKFQAPEDVGGFRIMVEALGGRDLGQLTIKDEYYDTQACDLTRKDMWLRKRGATWEFKVPADGAPARSGGERTSFQEIIGAPAVTAALAAKAPKLFRSDYDIETVLMRAECKVFAEFETVRSKFHLHDCTIDVDIASFGHAVMEIETLVESSDDVPKAHDSIQRVADLLQATPLPPQTGGKLESYIRRFCPTALDILVDNGVLSR